MNLENNDDALDSSSSDYPWWYHLMMFRWYVNHRYGFCLPYFIAAKQQLNDANRKLNAFEQIRQLLDELASHTLPHVTVRLARCGNIRQVVLAPMHVPRIERLLFEGAEFANKTLQELADVLDAELGLHIQRNELFYDPIKSVFRQLQPGESDQLESAIRYRFIDS